MERRWRANVRKSLLAAVFVLTTGQPMAAAAEATCPPTAVVSGADDLVEGVTALLRQHGVGSNAADCEGHVVRASLTRDSRATLHTLHIDDGFGRTSDRKVEDASTAASLIESWALGEDMNVLFPRGARPDAVASAPVGLTAAGAPAVSPAVSLFSTPVGWRLSAGAEMSTDLHHAALTGAGVTGCARVRPVCVGGGLRVVRGTENATVPAPVPAPATAPATSYDVTRTAAELTATVSLPMVWTHFAVVPLWGLGMGWRRASAALPNPFSFRVSRDDTSIIVETAVIGGLRLATRWSILMRVGAVLGGDLSGQPSNVVAALLSPPAAFALRTGIAIEYAR